MTAAFPCLEIRSGEIELVLWAQISSTKGSKTYYLYLTFLNMFVNKNGREKNRRGNEITLRFTTGHIFYLIIFFFQQGRQSH